MRPTSLPGSLLVAPAALAALAATASCAHEAPPPHRTSPVVAMHRAVEATPSEAEPPARSDGRLTRTLLPTRYAIELEVDPRATSFRGHTRIRANVLQATSFVVLHGRGLHVTRVVADTQSGKIVGHARTRRSHGAVEDDEIVLRFDRPLPAGDTTIAISYEAPFGDALAGLYRVQEGNDAYAFTQFEATDARRAFPCLDEPDVKVPFDVVVKVPKPMIAVSNMPEAWHADSGASTVFAFQTTPPLPTYLVALAVGNLDVREGRKRPFPVRLVTVHGKADLGVAALQATEKLVDTLGDYFGIRYPYPKLDIVAVPNFAAGAMENAGLITFREEILLQDPKHPSARTERNQALTIAHELAHQWFGDLVTMRWWDDTWLNEGFATWMETKAVDRYRPDYEATLEQIGSEQSVMDTDALASARRVRQPVESVGEIDEAFDGITYDKGAAVLRMLEGYTGEEAFQRGVASYLRAHAWGNATAHDLLVELERASGKPLTKIATSFLDQTGVPTVSVDRECGPKSYTLTLLQFPWQPTGAPPPPRPLPQWDIPVCLGIAGDKTPKCLAFANHATTIEGTGACPAWVHPNVREQGYYRFVLSAEQAMALAQHAKTLDVASRVGVVANLWAMVRAGTLGVDVLLRALPLFDGDDSPHVIEAVTSVLDGLDGSAISEAARPAFRAYVTARLRRHARALGWTPKKGEAPGQALARRAVLSTLGETAEDPATLREADALAARWLSNREAVDPDAAAIALELGSRHAGEARFTALLAVHHDAKLPQARILALRALGGFGDPALLRRALDLLLTDDVRQQDAIYVLRAAMAHRASRPLVLAWVQAHWDLALARFTSHLAHPLLSAISGVCTSEQVSEVRAFFQPRIGAVEGGARPLAEGIERAAHCADLRADIAPNVDRYFHVAARDQAAAAGSSK